MQATHKANLNHLKLLTFIIWVYREYSQMKVFSASSQSLGMFQSDRLLSCFLFRLQSLRCCQCSSNPSMPQLTARSPSPLLASLLDLLTLWSHGTGTFPFPNTEHWSLTYGSEKYWTGKHPALKPGGPSKMKHGCKHKGAQIFHPQPWPLICCSSLSSEKDFHRILESRLQGFGPNLPQ